MTSSGCSRATPCAKYRKPLKNIDMDNYTQWDRQHLWHPFTPMGLWLDSQPVVIEKAEGVYLYDTDGNRYIDGVSSLWCNVHGHNHPHINAAIRQQLDRVAHSTLLGLTNPSAAQLAKMLVDIAPEGLTRVFYSDSGSTSVEIALKIAYQYNRIRGHDRKRFIGLAQAYHGDTLGAVSVGGISTFHEIFGPLTFDVLRAPCPHPYRFDGNAAACKDHCLAALQRLLEDNADDVAAIIVEPLVQGAAGIIVHPPGYLAGVRKLADQFDVPLILDEVATGFGRTGTMFACAQEQVQPDILCVAKGLTGGYLPLAATLVSEEIFAAFNGGDISQTTFYHGHTYNGNALACAAAIASLEVFEQENTLAGLPDKIASIERYLQHIAKLEHVGDVRQRGMMAGIELVADVSTGESFAYQQRVGAKLCESMRRRGVMLRPLGDVIVLMPPLSIALGELEYLLQVVEKAIANDLAGVVAGAK